MRLDRGLLCKAAGPMFAGPMFAGPMFAGLEIYDEIIPPRKTSPEFVKLWPQRRHAGPA